MKKTETLQKHIEKVVKNVQKPSSLDLEVEEQQLEFVDFNKSIEKMLTAKPTDCSIENVLSHKFI